MYAQICTQQDISFDVVMLSQYEDNSRMDHEKIAKKVPWWYLQNTNAHVQKIRSLLSEWLLEFGLVDSRKSSFGYVFLLARRAILRKIKNRYFITTTIMEVEFIACFEA